ncbi:MAG: DivIVA domain-containing protein [Coriobacteriia bacterium]|nr:DivIVA domain-containing protein [Coriobacteriia bacterium]
MKLTALDIHHKEFRHSLRGYSEEEVDGFLDQVADEFDRLFKENIDISEKLEQANERVRGYQSMEATLNNTLVSAQRSAEEIVAKAGVEADAMLRDAEQKSKEIVHNALQKKQTVANELVRIKHAEEEFRARYKTMLEGHLSNITEIGLPEDINVLLDDSDGLVGAVDVRPGPAYAAPSYAPAPNYASPAPAAEPAPAAPETATQWAPPVTTSEPAAPQPTGGIFDADADETTVLPLVEPPASGFVSSVSLGEMESPELPDGPVELVEPGEFELPGFDILGERERDTDIEEID